MPVPSIRNIEVKQITICLSVGNSITRDLCHTIQKPVTAKAESMVNI